MADIILGIFTIIVIGSGVTAGLAIMGLAGMAIVEWVKYRRREE